MNILPPTVCPSTAGPMQSRTQRSRAGRRNGAIQRGVTLIEMLVAMAITLIMMGAVISVFGLIGTNVAGNRALVEMSERMDSVRGRLQKDLAGVTASMKLTTSPDSESGYFEAFEGPGSDSDAIASGTVGTPGYGVMGDVNDALMFTVRSNGEPYSGRIASILASGDVTSKSIQSQTAEVTWLVAPTPGRTTVPNTVPSYTLYRRVILIGGFPAGAIAGMYQNPTKPSDPLVPMLELPTTANFTPAVFSGDVLATVQAQAQDYANKFLSMNDVSLGQVITPSTTSPYFKISFVPNTLSELTKRENRFMHNLVAGFPYPVLLSSGPTSGRPTSPYKGTYFFDTTLAQWYIYDGSAWQPNDQGVPVFPPTTPKPNQLRYGDDVILTNVLSFDVRVFDPTAPLSIVNGVAIGPSDIGYQANPPKTPAADAYGAYVDLGYSNPTGYPLLQFSKNAYNTSKPPGMTLPSYVFDTWSTSYEQSGYGTIVPTGANGLDDPPAGVSGGVPDGVIDDPAEATFPPPFAIPAGGSPLRGVQVKIRCYEPDSRQVREVTVVQDFLPNN